MEVCVGMSKVWADMTSACVSFGPFLIASVSPLDIILV